MAESSKTTATPIVQSPSAPVGTCESYQPLLDQYDWDTHIAMAIMKAESHCTTTAVGVNQNGTNDAGLMQINSIHVQSGLVTDSGRFDPATNIRAAYAIYRGGGWRAWSTFNNGSYLKYL